MCTSVFRSHVILRDLHGLFHVTGVIAFNYLHFWICIFSTCFVHCSCTEVLYTCVLLEEMGVKTQLYGISFWEMVVWYMEGWVNRSIIWKEVFGYFVVIKSFPKKRLSLFLSMFSHLPQLSSYVFEYYAFTSYEDPMVHLTFCSLKLTPTQSLNLGLWNWLHLNCFAKSWSVWIWCILYLLECKSMWVYEI